MAKSKLVKANEKIAEGVVEGYKKIEDGVVGGYKKIEKGTVNGFNKVADKFVCQFLTKEGESVGRQGGGWNAKKSNAGAGPGKGMGIRPAALIMETEVNEAPSDFGYIGSSRYPAGYRFFSAD